MSSRDILNYYTNLLIMQYKGLPKAEATISSLVSMAILPTTSLQLITLSGVPASGSFIFQYGEEQSSAISWNASTPTIQTALQAMDGLGSVTVSGSLGSQSLEVTFSGVIPPALSLIVPTNTLQTAAPVPILFSISAQDNTLPIEVQNAYNVDTAEGVQLDVLAKYVGTTRFGYDFTGPVTLVDDDLRTLIRLSIFENNSGSSLYDIQRLISIFFPDSLRVFDHSNMHMDYFLDSDAGSRQLAEFFVKQGLLPRPMGVQIGALIYGPDINNFFGFRTYLVPEYNNSPFNTYADYESNTPWLSYSNAVIP